LVNITAGRLADGICSHAKKDRTMSSSTARWNERLHPATTSTSRPNTQAKTGHDDKKQRVKLHITYHCLFSRLSHLFYMDGRSFSLSLLIIPAFSSFYHSPFPFLLPHPGPSIYPARGGLILSSSLLSLSFIHLLSSSNCTAQQFLLYPISSCLAGRRKRRRAARAFNSLFF